MNLKIQQSMPTPKVSVIIPIYNTANYLREALDSICNQTLIELEIILINDGSTDDSQKIIEEYAAKDTRIQYHTQPNQGQGVARNHGMQYATGQYIYFMDSDDILDITALQECLNICELNNLDFAFFDADIITETKAQHIPEYSRVEKLSSKIWNGMNLLTYELDQHIFRISVWLCFVRKSFLEKHFKGFPSGIIHEDHIFAMQIHLNAQRAFYIPKPFFKRRVRPNSTMTSRFNMRNIEGYTTVCNIISDMALQYPQWNSIIKMYLKQTLNAVIWAGHEMTFLEKVETVCRFRRLKLSKYITFRNWIVFWMKNKY